VNNIISRTIILRGNNTTPSIHVSLAQFQNRPGGSLSHNSNGNSTATENANLDR